MARDSLEAVLLKVVPFPPEEKALFPTEAEPNAICGGNAGRVVAYPTGMIWNSFLGPQGGERRLMVM